VLRRHPDIYYRQVRLLLADQPQEPIGAAGLADDLHARAVPQAGQPLAQQDVIVSQDHARAARIHTTIIGPDHAECYGEGLAAPLS